MLASGCAWALVALVALRVRGRTYAMFVGILLATYTLCAIALFPELPAPMRYAAYYAHGAVYLHYALLARPKMRDGAYRVLVSLPASYILAGTVLGLVWAIAIAARHPLPWPWAPYLVAAVGFWQSIRGREQTVDVALDGAQLGDVPARIRGGAAREDTPLTIVQLTDTHIGPFMSVARLRRIAQRAVERKPDLVILTGDFLTMESSMDPTHLAEALAPLRDMPEGRVVACRGNHDHEYPEVIDEAMRRIGARLLVDDAVTLETPKGRVQILGADYKFPRQGRAESLRHLCARFPREPGALRLLLLHDPGAFKHVPEGEADLVLSGHVHGGQIGLVSLGIDLTIPQLFGFPDHGFWARGRDRMYVHRGTGHYGFPLRVGVPSEESLLRVHRTAPREAS
ncbi:MAG: metallophosphoesterase [Myxococcales bacterium]|nr:metallophosphoesterase [Myxococcales bacterium]